MDDLEMDFLWIISMLSCAYKVQYHCSLYNAIGLLFCKNASIDSWICPPDELTITDRVRIYTSFAYYHKPSIQDELQFLEDIFLLSIMEYVDVGGVNHQTDNATILRTSCDRVIKNSSVVVFISDYKKAIDGITGYALRKAKVNNKSIITFNPHTLKFHDPNNVLLFNEKEKFGFRNILQ